MWTTILLSIFGTSFCVSTLILCVDLFIPMRYYRDRDTMPFSYDPNKTGFQNVSINEKLRDLFIIYPAVIVGLPFAIIYLGIKNILQLSIFRREINIECKICFDRPVSIVMIPCGHTMCCDVCAESQDRCPVCRIEIKSKQKLFF
jgi:hypothetical protein